MNTKILEYIIAIAQERTISGAAERFYLTQPVLSRHLRKIEEHLGAPLFLRQKEGMVLTEAGRVFINSAQNILHLESELEHDLRTMREQEKNTLRVYTDYPYTDQLTGYLLPQIREQYKDVHIRVACMKTEEILAFLASGEQGIGILTAAERRVPGLEYVPLYTDAQVVVKPENPEAADTVFMLPASTSLRMRQDRWLMQAGAHFSTIMEVSSFRAALNGVQMEQGCGCILRSMAEQAGLVPCPEIPAAVFQVSAVYNRNMVFRPAALALLQSMISGAGRMSP